MQRATLTMKNLENHPLSACPYHSTECNLPEESDWKYFIILTLAPIPRCSILYLVLGYTLI